MSTTHYNNFPTHYNNLSIVRHHTSDQTRGLFRAAKEFVRFVFTTIVIVESSKCTANAASIIANYHKTTSSSSSTRNNSNRGGRSNTNVPFRSGDVVLGGNHQHLNLWHFRTFSTCDAVKTTSFEDRIIARGGTVRRRSTVFRGRNRKDRNGDDGAEMEGRRATMTSARSSSTRAVVDSIHDDEYENNPFDNPEYQPTVAEMKAQLGPIGLLIANSVEVGITTAGSYLSGGLFGYLIGGAMGVPGIFRNVQKGASTQGTLANGAHNHHNGMKELQRRIGDWNGKALAQGKSWAALSASFSGFHALTRVCRGGVEDRWNSIIGSAATGAYLSRQGGPQAMLQAAGSYASFTYILDMLFSSGDKKNNMNGGEFDFRDQPIPAESRGY